MAVPDHPMRALKGTREAREMMARVRAHRGGDVSKAHPGFKAVQEKIAREEGVSKDRAGAILAASSRNASAAAKKKNPRLERVAGARKGGRSYDEIIRDHADRARR